MLKRGSCLIAIFWGICCWPGAVHAQQSTVKRLGHGYYRQPVGDEKKSSYAFDWYAPEGKVEGLRPLVINLHGGGFKLGVGNGEGAGALRVGAVEEDTGRSLVFGDFQHIPVGRKGNLEVVVGERHHGAVFNRTDFDGVIGGSGRGRSSLGGRG